MGHEIQGLVAASAATAKAALVHSAVPFPLRTAGLAFIPMTDILFDRLSALFQAPIGYGHSEFWKLSGSATLWVREVSTAGRVAYIDTDYFGGAGVQAAALWEAGVLIHGPTEAESGPVNEVLRLLGVKRTKADDELAVAGLDRLRRNED